MYLLFRFVPGKKPVNTAPNDALSLLDVKVTNPETIPDPADFPRYMVAVNRKFITMPSPNDGQHGLAVFWTRAAAKTIARHTPGRR